MIGTLSCQAGGRQVSAKSTLGSFKRFEPPVNTSRLNLEFSTRKRRTA